MKSIRSFSSRLKPPTAVIAFAICLVGGVRFPMMAQSPSSLATRSSPGSEPSSALHLLLVFQGALQIGAWRSGEAVISDAGLSNIHDITFTRIGGELSPDGRLIAFENCGSPDRGIYLAEPDGRNARKVIPMIDGYCTTIRWSPDSTKLSFISGQDRTIHVFHIAENRDSLIPNSQGAGWHWWSPAGDQIVYDLRDGPPPSGRLLHITDLAGNNRQLTFAKDFAPCERERNLIDAWAPAWSPKGDLIAFTQCSALFVISPNGKDLRQLTTPRYASPTERLPENLAYSPRWTPDGRWIIFLSRSAVLNRISPNDQTLVDVGKLPYWGGPFSIAPVRQ